MKAFIFGDEAFALVRTDQATLRILIPHPGSSNVVCEYTGVTHVLTEEHVFVPSEGVVQVIDGRIVITFIGHINDAPATKQFGWYDAILIDLDDEDEEDEVEYEEDFEDDEEEGDEQSEIAVIIPEQGGTSGD